MKEEDSKKVILAAELIINELTRKHNRMTAPAIMERFNLSKAAVFKAVRRLEKQNLVSRSKLGVETYYYPVEQSAKHLTEIEAIRRLRKSEASKADKEVQRKITEKKAEERRAEVAKAARLDGLDLTRNCKLMPVRESAGGVGVMRFYKHSGVKA